MKWILLTFLSIFFFQGCLVRSFFDQNQRRTIQAISSDKDKEVFYAVIDTIPYGFSEKKIIRIDSNGSIRLLNRVDNNLDNTLLNILSDTLLLCQHVSPSDVYLYNLKTCRKSNILATNSFQSISNDKEYFITEDYSNKPAYNVCKIIRDSIILISSFPDSIRLGSQIWQHYFTMKQSKPLCEIIVNPDLIVIDTIPNQLMLFSFLSSGNNNHRMIFISYSNEVVNHVLKYDFEKKKTDTLFSGAYFTNAILIPNTDFCLVQGMSKKDYEYENRLRSIEYGKFEQNNAITCSLHAQIYGYWMVGNMRTKQMKKIEFDDYTPLVSSSGRHVLFYTQYSDDGKDKIKVVSVKDLIEGM